MKVSEVVTALTDHQPDGPVVIQEIDAVSTFFLVESVTKKDGVPILMARHLNKPPEVFVKLFNEFLHSQPDQHKAAIVATVDEKYLLTVDGKPLLPRFDTEAEAQIFLRGFIEGFTSRTAEAK